MAEQEKESIIFTEIQGRLDKAYEQFPSLTTDMATRMVRSDFGATKRQIANISDICLQGSAWIARNGSESENRRNGRTYNFQTENKEFALFSSIGRQYSLESRRIRFEFQAADTLLARTTRFQLYYGQLPNTPFTFQTYRGINVSDEILNTSNYYAVEKPSLNEMTDEEGIVVSIYLGIIRETLYPGSQQRR